MAAPAGSLTPDRAVSVTWDIPETFLAEQHFQKRRAGGQILPASKSNVMLLSSGCWILKPLNLDMNPTHELTAGSVGMVRLADSTAISTVAEVPQFRNPTELSGISADAGVQSTGDYFFTKRVTSGTSWNSSLAGGDTQPTLTTTNYPMDRVLAAPTSGTYDAMTGYLLRWVMPGAHTASPDSIMSFYFGGSVLGGTGFAHTGYGRFCLNVSGDGRCVLFEWIDAAWSQVADWRFAGAGWMPHGMGSLAIIPHFPRYIEFRSAWTENPHTMLDMLVASALAAIRIEQGDGLRTFLYETTNRGADAFQANGTGPVRPITGAGNVMFDVRRDLRLSWQVNRLCYPASGTLTDRPFTVPGQVTDGGSGGNPHILRVDPLSWNYSADGVTQLTSVTFQAQDATTGSNLTGGNQTGSFNGAPFSYTGWKLPGGQNEVQVVATLATSESSPRYHTPSMIGYEAKRTGTNATINNGAKSGGILREFSSTGPGFNPDEDTANLVISDTKNELTFVRQRGRMGVRVETTYPSNAGKTAVIFEGYLGRCDSSLRGKNGMVYPSANWRDLSCDLIGKADRMRHAYFHNYEIFFDDSRYAPSGNGSGANPQPWKITDIIRHSFNLAGFDDSQLDIFDDPLRLFPTLKGNAAGLYVPALGSSVLDYILMLARDFHNAFVVWDANAGSAGMWRLLRPPTGTETPLWNFTKVPAVRGRLQHLSASYPANTSPVLSIEPYKEYVVAPEGNQLTVYGGYNKTEDGKGYHQIRAHISNRASWNAPGFSQSDTTNLDYLGMIVPVAYTDLLIRSQVACNWIARRIFNLACRGRQFVTFAAELVLVQPSDSVYSTHVKRPLRLGDTVNLDGVRYLVHSCSPIFNKSANQAAKYELELYRPELTWGVRP
jgi:hypothetical protein